MKKIIFSFLLGLSVAGVFSFAKTSSAQTKSGDCKCVTSALENAEKLRAAGVTRKNIYENFTEEGGLSSLIVHRYVSRECPYIKIDVTFDPVNKKDGPAGNPEDKIVTISKPYLEYSILD